MHRLPSPEQQAERREDEGRMWVFVTALVLPLLALAGWLFVELAL